MPDVDVPLLGKTPRGAVLAGGVAVLGVTGYLLYKHFTKPKTVVSPTTGAYGYQAYGYHPSYGYAYGYGAYSPYGEYGFGGSGYPNPYGYGPGPQSYGYKPITTNAQWGQAAEAAMGSTGGDSIAAAIAKYLSGAPVTQAQELIIQEAIAVVGNPPVSGPADYPPKIHVTKTGPGGGGNVSVPNVVGQEVDAAQRTLTAAGLVVSRPKLKTGHGYTVTAENPAAGASVATGSTITLSIKENR